ncbi:MAG: hypothetical protein H0U28_09025 [Nocardioidaceae bacterium]|nr:hypothetical protein [Nocardioidaceae bacterium]
MPLAAWLMIAGATLLIVGSFLPWFTIADESFSGMNEIGGEARDGPVFVGLGVIIGIFGIITLVWKRILGVVIAALVVAAFALIAGIIDFADVQDLKDFFGVDAGIGLPMIIAGAALAAVGSIVGLVKRSR